MSDVNKQLLDALVTLVESHDANCSDTDKKWALVDARLAIAAAEQAQQSQPPATSDDSSVVRDEVAVPTIKLGLYGRAFDAPQTRRAYTYQHQPNNLDAYKLGRAAASTSPGGDNIDRGLSLLKQLQAHGFGVFELGDQQEGGV